MPCLDGVCTALAVYHVHYTLGSSPRITFTAGARAAVFETADLTAGAAVCLECAIDLLARIAQQSPQILVSSHVEGAIKPPDQVEARTAVAKTSRLTLVR